jgi:hypothetical protein
MRIRFAPCLLLAPLALGACMRRARESTETWDWKTDMSAGSTLHLRDVKGDITVRAAPGATMEVTGSKRWTHGRPNSVKFEAQSKGSDVSVCAMFGDRGSCSADGYRGRATGYHRVLGFSWGSDARADLVVSLPAGVKLDASTVDGGIIVEGAKAPVTLKSMNGSIKAATSVGPMTAVSINGSIDARVESLPKGSGPLTFTTVNGDVTALLPAALDAIADLETINGSISSDFGLAIEGQYGPHHARGTLGAGGATLHMQTINGRVTLRKS